MNEQKTGVGSDGELGNGKDQRKDEGNNIEEPKQTRSPSSSSGRSWDHACMCRLRA